MMVYGKDFFRDTKVRYLGYANEIGEALRPMIDVKYVRYSYGIAFGYVLADVVDKAMTKFLSREGRPTKVLWATGDALIWQSLASLVIPGIAINRIMNYSEFALATHYAHKIPHHQRFKLTIGIGLASIPIIVYPIDWTVTQLMNFTYRQIFRIVYYSNIAIAKRYPKIPQNIRVKMTVGIGLASIPVIIYPIDLAVHALMNLTYRKLYTEEELPVLPGETK